MEQELHPLQEKFVEPRRQEWQIVFEEAIGLRPQPKGYITTYDAIYGTGLRLSMMGCSHDDAEIVWQNLCERDCSGRFKDKRHLKGFFFAGFYSDPYWKSRMFCKFKHLDGDL